MCKNKTSATLPLVHGVSVFHYQDPKQFLRDWISDRQKKDASFSVRRLARSMEISHALLLMFLQGKRTLKVNHVPALNRGLGLSAAEKQYLQALIEFEMADSYQEKELLSLWLKDLNPESDFSIKEVDEFKSISSWIHMAILAFCDLKVKTHDPEVLVKRFKSKVNEQEIRAAVTRLFTLGLLKRDEEGNFQSTYKKVSTKNDLANTGATEYHKQVSLLAALVVEEQALLEREFQAFAMPLDPAKLPLAKELFRKFRNELFLALKSEKASEVYQINLQLFRLTERSSALKQIEDEGVDKANSKGVNDV